MPTAAVVGAKLEAHTPLGAMSEEQLSALLAKLKEEGATGETHDLDAVVALAKEAGLDVSKADWLKYQAKQALELSDEEVEELYGGNGPPGGGVGGHIWFTPT